MSKVCLITPPQTQLLQPRAYIPLGLAYLGAALEEAGIEVEVLNLADVENIEGVNYPDADWYGVTCISATQDAVKGLVPFLRGKVAVGGPHPSVFPVEAADTLGVDVVMAGEAEHLFRDVVTGKTAPKAVMDAGIIADLNCLPQPARHLFDREDVVDRSGIHGQEEGVPATTVITSRGCPYRCTFCCKGHPMFTQYRYRGAVNVLEELLALKVDYGIEHIRFVDDEFTLYPKRIAELMREIKPLDMTWVCITRADTLSPRLLRLMRQAGCVEVHVGVESGSNRVLERMNKKTSAEVLLKGIRAIKEAGIRAKTYLMYGFPGETGEDREKTVEFMRQAKPDKFTVSRFVPLPGSAIAENNPSLGRQWFYPDENADFTDFRKRITEAIK